MSYDAWQKKGNNDNNKKKETGKERKRVGVRGKTYVYVKEEACALDNNILKIELNC